MLMFEIMFANKIPFTISGKSVPFIASLELVEKEVVLSMVWPLVASVVASVVVVVVVVVVVGDVFTMTNKCISYKKWLIPSRRCYVQQCFISAWLQTIYNLDKALFLQPFHFCSVLDSVFKVELRSTLVECN